MTAQGLLCSARLSAVLMTWSETLETTAFKVLLAFMEIELNLRETE